VYLFFKGSVSEKFNASISSYIENSLRLGVLGGQGAGDECNSSVVSRVKREFFKKYQTCLAYPGEAVGTLAAQGDCKNYTRNEWRR
jgi:hypothetical protein